MGSWCQKSLLKSLFYLNSFSSIYKKKLQNHTSLSSLPYKTYKSIFTSISRVFRVNQVFFSSRGPHFCTNCRHCGRLIHDRKMHNILRARFDSPILRQTQLETHERKVEIKCIAWRPLTSKKIMPCYRASG